MTYVVSVRISTFLYSKEKKGIWGQKRIAELNILRSDTEEDVLSIFFFLHHFCPL